LSGGVTDEYRISAMEKSGEQPLGRLLWILGKYIERVGVSGVGGFFRRRGE